MSDSTFTNTFTPIAGTFTDPKFTDVTYGGGSKSSGGSFSNEVAMSLIFFDEIKRLSFGRQQPPVFDAGFITESLGNGKYKLKLMCLGSVVIGIDTMGEGIKGMLGSRYDKGLLALVLCQTDFGGATTYYMMSVKRVSNYSADKIPTHPV